MEAEFTPSQFDTIQSNQPAMPGFAYLDVTLYLHRNAVSILWAYCAHMWEEDTDEKPGSIEEFLALEFMGTDINEQEHQFTVQDMLEGIGVNGFYGFANTIKGEVHVWLRSDNNNNRVRHLLGHELGHIAIDAYMPIDTADAAVPAKAASKQPPVPTGVPVEEWFADLFGWIARQVENWLWQIRQVTLRYTKGFTVPAINEEHLGKYLDAVVKGVALSASPVESLQAEQPVAPGIDPQNPFDDMDASLGSGVPYPPDASPPNVFVPTVDHTVVTKIRYEEPDQEPED